MADLLENERWTELRDAPVRFPYPIPDTRWFFVEFLRSSHLDELRAMGRCGWDDPSDLNELRKVAIRWNEQLTVPQHWNPPPVLWGHTMKGPFTILDGNH